MPKGYEQIAADAVYYNPTTFELVITGAPTEDEETHNCDLMGCSSIGHVIFRAKAASFSYSPLRKKVEPYLYKVGEERA